MFQYHARIVSVYDGDTVRADIDLGFGIWALNQPLRVHGIDTPELSVEDGKRAREFARGLLPDQTRVTMTTFKDKKEKFGRYLGQITLPDGSDFASRMIEAGHAKTYFGGTKEP